MSLLLLFHAAGTTTPAVPTYVKASIDAADFRVTVSQDFRVTLDENDFRVTVRDQG